VVGACALQRHAAAVVADRADRRHVIVVEQRLAGECRELGALVLDRAGVLAALLDQRRGDAADGGMCEIPGAGELQRCQAVALGDRAHRLDPIESRLDPAGGAERAVVVGAESVP